MLKIVGFIVAFGSVIGGYLASSGYLSALIHINEIWMILGCAIGVYIVSNSGHVIAHSLSMIGSVFTGGSFKQPIYREALLLTFEILTKIKMNGAKGVENEFEDPESSDLFKKYPLIYKNKRAVAFICDNFRFVLNGSYAPHDMESYIDNEIETIKESAEHAPHSVQVMADAMPAYGILAAVAGVILTMGYINDSTDVIANHIAIALAGTFLGILFGYAVFAPLANAMNALVDEEVKFYSTLKMGILSHINGYNPADGVEIARKCMPEELKIPFAEMDQAIQDLKKGG